MNQKKLIVFDIDGTLSDSVAIHQKAFTESLYEIGITKIDAEFKSFKHHTDSFISKEIYENNKQQKFSQAKVTAFENELFERINAYKISEITGAKELIEKIEKREDYAICYATGSLRRAAEYKLASIGINFKRHQLVASDNIYDREGIVSTAISNSLKFYDLKEFEKIISVGDGLWDLITAQNLNLDFIGVGKINEAVLRENGAKTIIKNLTYFELK